MILFLDFDGVLHPDQVFITPKGPQLQGPGELFMWAPALEEALNAHPDVKIVLSTSWVRQIGFSKAKKRLPPSLRARVVGSTWHSSMSKVWADEIWWDHTSRYGQILQYVVRARLTDWVALDDDAENWGNDDLSRLLRADPSLGLTTPNLLTQLLAILAQPSEQ